MQLILADHRRKILHRRPLLVSLASFLGRHLALQEVTKIRRIENSQRVLENSLAVRGSVRTNVAPLGSAPSNLPPGLVAQGHWGVGGVAGGG